LHRKDQSLVAVLELLSPANKEQPGHGGYLIKRNKLLHQGVHLVEVDLLLKGARVPLSKPLPPGDLYAFVSRADRRPDCQVYSWGLRNRLPAIPLPLSAPDLDILVDLAVVFATTYERGRYLGDIDYAAPLKIPLNGTDHDWVMQTAKRAPSQPC
jgi:hypothetical protein